MRTSTSTTTTRKTPTTKQQIKTPTTKSNFRNPGASTTTRSTEVGETVIEKGEDVSERISHEPTGSYRSEGGMWGNPVHVGGTPDDSGWTGGKKEKQGTGAGDWEGGGSQAPAVAGSFNMDAYKAPVVSPSKSSSSPAASASYAQPQAFDAQGQKTKDSAIRAYNTRNSPHVSKSSYTSGNSVDGYKTVDNTHYTQAGSHTPQTTSKTSYSDGMNWAGGDKDSHYRLNPGLQPPPQQSGGGMNYTGGTPHFDESTGKYTGGPNFNQPEYASLTMAPGTDPEYAEKATEDWIRQFQNQPNSSPAGRTENLGSTSSYSRTGDDKNYTIESSQTSGSVTRGGTTSIYEPGTPITERGLSPTFGTNTASGGTEPTITQQGGTSGAPDSMPGFQEKTGQDFDSWWAKAKSTMGNSGSGSNVNYSVTGLAPSWKETTQPQEAPSSTSSTDLLQKRSDDQYEMMRMQMERERDEQASQSEAPQSYMEYGTPEQQGLVEEYTANMMADLNKEKQEKLRQENQESLKNSFLEKQRRELADFNQAHAEGHRQNTNFNMNAGQTNLNQVPPQGGTALGDSRKQLSGLTMAAPEPPPTMAENMRDPDYKPGQGYSWRGTRDNGRWFFDDDPKLGLPSNIGDWTDEHIKLANQRGRDTGISHGPPAYSRRDDGAVLQHSTGHTPSAPKVFRATGYAPEPIPQTDVNQVPPQGGTVLGDSVIPYDTLEKNFLKKFKDEQLLTKHLLSSGGMLGAYGQGEEQEPLAAQPSSGEKPSGQRAYEADVARYEQALSNASKYGYHLDMGPAPSPLDPKYRDGESGGWSVAPGMLGAYGQGEEQEALAGGRPNHMAGVTPDNPAAGSKKNPYGFAPPDPSMITTQARVPYHNPTTGEAWTAPSGGWQAPKGWKMGKAPAPKQQTDSNDQLFGIGEFMNDQVEGVEPVQESQPSAADPVAAAPSSGQQWMNDSLRPPQIYNAQAQSAFDLLQSAPSQSMQSVSQAQAPDWNTLYSQMSDDDIEYSANKSIMQEFPEYAPSQTTTTESAPMQMINVGGEKAGDYSDKLQDVVGIDSQPSIYETRREQARSMQPVSASEPSYRVDDMAASYTNQSDAPSTSAAAPSSSVAASLPTQEAGEFSATQPVSVSPGNFQMSGTENDQTWNFGDQINSQAIAQAYMSPDYAPSAPPQAEAPSVYEQALQRYQENFPDQPDNYGRRTTTFGPGGQQLGQSTGYSNDAEAGRLDYQAALINRINKARRPHFQSLGFSSRDAEGNRIPLDTESLMSGARQDVKDGFSTQFYRDAIASGVDPNDPDLRGRLDEMLGISNEDYLLDEDGNPMMNTPPAFDFSKYLPPPVEQTEWETPGIDIRYGRPDKPENEGQWTNPVDAFGNPIKRKNWFGYGPGRMTNTGDQLVSTNVPQ